MRNSPDSVVASASGLALTSVGSLPVAYSIKLAIPSPSKSAPSAASPVFSVVSKLAKRQSSSGVVAVAPPVTVSTPVDSSKLKLAPPEMPDQTEPPLVSAPVWLPAKVTEAKPPERVTPAPVPMRS